MAGDPPIRAHLLWQEGESFRCRIGERELTLDGAGEQGLSPMQHLALAVAGCMAIDVVHILARMRTPVTSLQVQVTATRAPTPPRRFTAIELQMQIHGDVAEAGVERAVALSRERYCSAWQSLRPDTILQVRWRIVR